MDTIDTNIPLITIALASNNPTRLKFWLHDLEKKLTSPQHVEILIAIHQKKQWMNQLPLHSYPFKIQYIESLSKKGYLGLHLDYHHLFSKRHPNSYFFGILSDTAYFSHKGWDKKLLTYQHYMSHDLFAVTFSNNRYMNYRHVVDQWHFPDNFSFFTTDFIETIGGIGPFWAPDAWFHNVIHTLTHISCKTNRGKKVIFRDQNLCVPIQYPYYIYRNKKQFDEYKIIRLKNVYNKFYGELTFYKKFLSWRGYHHVHQTSLSLINALMQRPHTPFAYHATKNPIVINQAFPLKLWLMYQLLYIRYFYYLPFYISTYYIFRQLIKNAFICSLILKLYYFLLKKRLYKHTLGYRLVRYGKLVKLWRQEYLLEVKEE